MAITRKEAKKRPKTPEDVRALARTYTTCAIRTLGGICSNPDSPAPARVAAAIALLDRGWGKPNQPLTPGVNGEELRITIRQIVDHRSRFLSPVPNRDKKPIIEHEPIINGASGNGQA